MMKILMPTIMLLPTITLCNTKQLWSTSMAHSFMIALLSLQLFKTSIDSTLYCSNYLMGVDQISSPLIMLSCWLTPLALLASQNHMITEPITRKQTFIAAIIILQISLIMAFSTTEMIMFFIMFETTLIPTLVIITRWGNQMERLNAGTYFLFYTLTGSLPLLIAILSFNTKNNTLHMHMMLLNQTSSMPDTWAYTMWSFALFTAFMIKMPLYGLHLWLPKAHVEAPIAGSMILAAVLLKLGGYGIMRATMMLHPLPKTLYYPFMILALWGMIMASSICLRETDLKSLIAYSSVSHMGLVIVATLTQTQQAYAGATTLMIAHGLTSSMLFCLANTNYERTHSRMLLLTQNMQLLLPLMSTWWLIASLTNMALPPTINLMGELIIILAIFDWSNITILMMGLGALITSIYTLHMYASTQWNELPSHIKTLAPTHTREHLIMALHALPMVLMMINPTSILW